MKYDDLKTYITKDPNGRASTSRFRLAGGTLWDKCPESGQHHPMVSHLGAFIIDWNWRSLRWHSEVEMSNRAENQGRELHESARLAWLEKLGTFGVVDDREALSRGEMLTSAAKDPEHYSYRYPAVSISFSFPNRKLLSVKKPSALATKMLALGKHPENGSSRIDWSTREGLMRRDRLRSEGSTAEEPVESLGEEKDPYKDCFTHPFEDSIKALAYGAVSRENSMRDMSGPLTQMKLALDNLSNDLTAEMNALGVRQDSVTGKQAPFAPVSIEEAGHSRPEFLRKFTGLLHRFRDMNARCASAADTYSQLSNAPDSLCFRELSTDVQDSWSFEWPRSIGGMELESHTNWRIRPEYIETSVSYSMLSIEAQPATGEDPSLNSVVFTDHNVRAFSYYWARRNKEFYEGILGKVGCNLPDLFGGLKPHEWDYLQLAAPLFADDQMS